MCICHFICSFKKKTSIMWYKYKSRGGWTRHKRYLNILLLIAFHVTLNSRNTKLKNYGVHWGSLDIQIVLQVMYFVFSRHLRFGVKLINCDLMHTTSPSTSPDLSRTFSIMKQRPFTALHRDRCITFLNKLILLNLF